MKKPPVIAVFGFSRDRVLFEQALRTFRRLVGRGEACAVRFYDDASDPAYPGGAGVPDGVARIETSWDRGGFRQGGFNEETVRGIVSALSDACAATGTDRVVKVDCDAALNSLSFLGSVDPATYGMFGNEVARNIAMGVTYAVSAACLARMQSLLGDKRSVARLVVLDKPEAQSMSLLAGMTGTKLYLVRRGATVGCGWRRSCECFRDVDDAARDRLMQCVSVFFRRTLSPSATPEQVDAETAAALSRMTEYVDALEERGDEVCPRPPARRWSRLSIKTALAQSGMLAAARAYLAGVEVAPGYTAAEALTDCDYIEEGYPDAKRWSAILDGAAQALGRTRADIDAFLDSIPVEA